MYALRRTIIMVSIEPTDELTIPVTHPTTSKYRTLLDNFASSDMERGKITCNAIVAAETIQKGLKRHRLIDEPIVIERRGNVVWLVKLT